MGKSEEAQSLARHVPLLARHAQGPLQRSGTMLHAVTSAMRAVEKSGRVPPRLAEIALVVGGVAGAGDDVPLAKKLDRAEVVALHKLGEPNAPKLSTLSSVCMNSVLFSAPPALFWG